MGRLAYRRVGEDRLDLRAAGSPKAVWIMARQLDEVNRKAAES